MVHHVAAARKGLTGYSHLTSHGIWFVLRNLENQNIRYFDLYCVCFSSSLFYLKNITNTFFQFDWISIQIFGLHFLGIFRWISPFAIQNNPMCWLLSISSGTWVHGSISVRHLERSSEAHILGWHLAKSWKLCFL